MGNSDGGADGRGRVVMVIDQLEAGGAQRQFCLLATALHRMGFAVRIVVFRRDSFFRDQLRAAADIPVAHLEARNLAHLAVRVRRTLRRDRPDAVISFLSWPNLLVEWAGIPRRPFAVIVSERNLDLAATSVRSRVRYFFHRFADVVVSNSHAQAELMSELSGHLASRTTVIVNGVDTVRFAPDPATPATRRGVRILVLARVAPQKNVLRFIDAVSIFRSRNPDADLVVDWYGKKPDPGESGESAWDRRARRNAAAYCRRVEEAIATHGLQGRFRLHAPVTDVERLYARADVVCLPSLHEGCSNVIAEAMACGVPVLASRISDNVRLVEDGSNGFLFDPLSPEDMADAIRRFGALPAAVRSDQGSAGRSRAVSMLSVDTFVHRYAELISGLIRDRGERSRRPAGA